MALSIRLAGLGVVKGIEELVVAGGNCCIIIADGSVDKSVESLASAWRKSSHLQKRVWVYGSTSLLAPIAPRATAWSCLCVWPTFPVVELVVFFVERGS